jgi:hypothetical protein
MPRTSQQSDSVGHNTWDSGAVLRHRETTPFVRPQELCQGAWSARRRLMPLLRRKPFEHLLVTRFAQRQTGWEWLHLGDLTPSAASLSNIPRAP